MPHVSPLAKVDTIEESAHDGMVELQPILHIVSLGRWWYSHTVETLHFSVGTTMDVRVKTFWHHALCVITLGDLHCFGPNVGDYAAIDLGLLRRRWREPWP